MSHDEGKHSLEAKFAAAVKVMRSLPEEGAFQPSDYMMLKFYSYYKQATLGPCNTLRPTGFWDSYGKAKWDAWSSLGNMTKEEAMKNYVEDIQLILETVPISDEVSDLVRKLGNFYAEVNVGEDEAEDVNRRPFTRPFANEGYGDLWDDIQNLEGKDRVQSVSSEEMEESREDSEIERKEESSDCRRSEEDENGDEEDYTEDEGKEDEEKECGSDSRRLMVEDTKWTSYTRGSCSSMEPSVSSFTNGTHSSLNSEAEDNELACSREPSIQPNPYMHLNGHMSDHSDAVSEKNYRSTDSDNEEFCDSMEHLAMEERKVESPEASSVKPRELWFESSTTLNGREDQVLIEISKSQHNSSLSRGGRVSGCRSPGATSELCVSVEAQCCCVSQKTPSVSSHRGYVNEQIATTLLRLQRDMADVLHRLHTLEVLATSQSRSSSPRQEEALPAARKFPTPSWWPFDCSPLTMVLTALWPLIAHWLVQLCLQRRRRKIP